MVWKLTTNRRKPGAKVHLVISSYYHREIGVGLIVCRTRVASVVIGVCRTSLVSKQAFAKCTIGVSSVIERKRPIQVQTSFQDLVLRILHLAEVCPSATQRGASGQTQRGVWGIRIVGLSREKQVPRVH